MSQSVTEWVTEWLTDRLTYGLQELLELLFATKNLNLDKYPAPVRLIKDKTGHCAINKHLVKFIISWLTSIQNPGFITRNYSMNPSPRSVVGGWLGFIIWLMNTFPPLLCDPSCHCQWGTKVKCNHPKQPFCGKVRFQLDLIKVEGVILPLWTCYGGLLSRFYLQWKVGYFWC